MIMGLAYPKFYVFYLACHPHATVENIELLQNVEE
jgi:hypothetical protein